MRAKKKFYKLAFEIVSNPSKFIRKTSTYHVKRYESGIDDYGDIVNWASRQLEAAKSAKYLAKNSGISVRVWFKYEAEILEMLMHKYAITDKSDVNEQ